MNQKIKFELVSSEHLDALDIYLQKVVAETDYLTLEKTALSIENIQNIFLNQFSTAIVALIGQDIIGLVQIRRNKKLSENHNGELAISVLQKYCGQQIGTQLMRLGIAKAKALGLKFIYLDVREDNQRAIKLYEKFGFTLYGVRPSYFHVGVKYFNDDLMLLDLTKC